MTHVALLFPPATDPRGPHLALPSLAAFLRRVGVRVTLRDLDIEGLLALIDTANVERAVQACAERLAGTPDASDRSRLVKVLANADFVLRHIGSAPARLRDPERFYQSHDYDEARECIGQALEILSAATGSVRYAIQPAEYSVAGVDASRLSDLARATAGPALNLFHEFYQQRVLPDLERDRPDVVGVSILNYAQVLPGLALARLLKERGYFVVIGGTLYSKFVPELMRRPEFFQLFCDGLIAYEGETALLHLLEQVTGDRQFDTVPNYLHLNAYGRPVIGSVHVEDVNALPTPDFDGLPLDSYLAPAPVLPILLGKGCYFNRCKFCDIPHINKVAGKAYRLRSLEHVAADVAALQQRYGARHFEITDEALAPRILLRLAEELAAYPDVKARFVGYARFEPGFTVDTCRRLYNMGMRKLFFGLESGSQATLDHMDKGIRIENAAAVLRNCADTGIAFHVFSIIGFPEETEDRARETLRFFQENAGVIDHPRNSFDIHPFGLDLRTEYAERPATFGVEFVSEDRTEQDFPLGITQWRNSRGLSEADVGRLLEEFHGELLRLFPTYRQYQGHLWPGFEEYALLYSDHYDGQPFQFRYTLPSEGDPLEFRLIWAPSVVIQPNGDGYAVQALAGEMVVTRAALLLLAQPPPAMTVDALLRSLVARVSASGSSPQTFIAELRGVINDLLQVGVLQLHPVSPVHRPGEVTC